MKANFETSFSPHRLKGWNRALSSYGSAGFNLYSPTEHAREVHAEARQEVHYDGLVHQHERHQQAPPTPQGPSSHLFPKKTAQNKYAGGSFLQRSFFGVCVHPVW
jgi:hypothetical protein